MVVNPGISGSNPPAELSPSSSLSLSIDVLVFTCGLISFSISGAALIMEPDACG